MNSTNNKYINLGAAWVRKTKDGKEMISLKVGTEEVTVIVRNKNGEEMVLTNAALFFNEEKKSEKSPDLRLTMNVEAQQ